MAVFLRVEYGIFIFTIGIESSEEDGEKCWKSLKYLSLKVKKIIQVDQKTTYKMIADKLVGELRKEKLTKLNNARFVKIIT